MRALIEHIMTLNEKLNKIDCTSSAVDFLKEIKETIDKIDYSDFNHVTSFQPFIVNCINFYNYGFIKLREDLKGEITKIPVKNIYLQGHLVKSIDFLYFKFCYNKIYHQRKLKKITILDFSEFFIHLVYNPSFFSLITLDDIKEIHSLFGYSIDSEVQNRKNQENEILHLNLLQVDFNKSFNLSRYLIEHIDTKSNLNPLIEELENEIKFHKQFLNQELQGKLKQINDYNTVTFKELVNNSIHFFDLVMMFRKNGYYKYNSYSFGINTNPLFVLSFYPNITQYVHPIVPNEKIDDYLKYIINHYNNSWIFRSNNINIVERKYLSYQSIKIDSELNRIFFDIPVSKISSFKEAIENKLFEEFYSYYYNDKFWKQLIVLLAYDAYYISQKGEFDFTSLLKDFLIIYFGTNNKKSTQ